MGQIFGPYANSIAKASILGGAALPVVAGLGLAALSRSPMNTKVQVALDQPIPFSHQHHNWELGIDCRYCHVSVEKSAYAGLPSTETCMSCHSQIWTNSPLLEPVRKSYETGTPIKWNLVNKVPDFVFFNHALHIAKGINCNTCHGPVQEMHITYKGNPFQMQWCLECHRNPGRYLYEDKAHPELSPRQQVFNFYWKIQAGEQLTEREQSLARGGQQTGGFNVGASDKPQELSLGKELVHKRGIRVNQLSDCSVCHH
jgi:hypothetical protein